MFIVVLLLCTLVAAQELPVRPGFRLHNGRWIRPAGKFEPRELVSARMEGRKLVVSYNPAAEWQPKLQVGRIVTAEHASDNRLWDMVMSVGSAPRPRVPGPGEPQGPSGASLTMLSVDESLPAEPAEIPPRLVRVTVTPQNVLLRGIGRYENGEARVEYAARCDGGAARLTLHLPDRGGLDVTGDDLGEILTRQPTLTRQFLGPMLQELCGYDALKPRAGDFYRAFDDIEPTSDELAKIGNVLPALDAADPAERDRASRTLDSLGPGAVLAAMRLDLARLTPEQASRISEFVHRNTTSDVEPAAARADPILLRAALNDTDPRVREAAKDRLAELAD
jgi:hypothetical protein